SETLAAGLHPARLSKATLVQRAQDQKKQQITRKLCRNAGDLHPQTTFLGVPSGRNHLFKAIRKIAGG
ncbi:MAG: hypothetical protein AAEJ43_13505, partial [Gammaproteobacteria bacterium]